MRPIIEKLMERKCIYAIAALIVVALYMGFLYYKYPFVYRTNDDRFMQDILSGSMTGTPEPHAIYLGYLLSLGLSFFYKFMPGVPWYGVFLIFGHFICLSLIMYRTLERPASIIYKISMAAVVFGIIALMETRQILLVQYTAVAILAGTAAIFWFITEDGKYEGKAFIKYHAVTVALALLSFLIRWKSFMLLLPLAGFVLVVKCWKGRAMQYIKFAAALVFGILVCFAIDKLGYSSAEWREFSSYNEYRTQIVDYEGYPPYEENQALYEELGLSRALYKGMSGHYFLLAADVDSGSMRQLAEASEQSKVKPGFIFIMRQMFSNLSGINNLEKIVAYMYLLAIFHCFALYICQKPVKEALFTLSALVVGRSASWYYLLYNGRMVEHVTVPLYLCELIALSAILTNCHAASADIASWQENKRDQKEHMLFKRPSFRKAMMVAELAMTAFVLLPLSKSALQEYYAAANRAMSSHNYNEGLTALDQYCLEHPDNIYLVDLKTVSYYTESLLDHDNVYQNYIVMGGWMVKSPLINEKIRKMGIEDLPQSFKHDNVYVMFGDHEEFPQDYFWEYLDQEYEYDAELVETVALSDYSSLLVYKIE